MLKFNAVQYAYPNVNLHLPTFVSQDMVGLPFCSPLKIAHFFIALTLNCFACIERSMNNLSINPAILFLRAYGLQDPEGNSRSLPENEISILQGYYDMLKRIEIP